MKKTATFKATVSKDRNSIYSICSLDENGRELKDLSYLINEPSMKLARFRIRNAEYQYQVGDEDAYEVFLNCIFMTVSGQIYYDKFEAQYRAKMNKDKTEVMYLHKIYNTGAFKHECFIDILSNDQKENIPKSPHYDGYCVYLNLDLQPVKVPNYLKKEQPSEDMQTAFKVIRYQGKTTVHEVTPEGFLIDSWKYEENHPKGIYLPDEHQGEMWNVGESGREECYLDSDKCLIHHTITPKTLPKWGLVRHKGLPYAYCEEWEMLQALMVATSGEQLLAVKYEDLGYDFKKSELYESLRDSSPNICLIMLMDAMTENYTIITEEFM